MDRKFLIPIILILGVLVVSGCVQQEDTTPYASCDSCCSTDTTPYGECDSCCSIPEGNGILNVEISDWAINEDNLSEIFFEYWIFNYGDTEAKDIVVRCKLNDEKDNLVISDSKRFGNLASESMVFDTLSTPKKVTLGFDEFYYGVCYVESCNNCVILYKRISELVESYSK